MRYKADQKAQTRQRIVAAAGRGFKKKGYSGIGVDGLAREAGVTSGAFYGHFASKEAAFNEALSCGLDELQAAISDLKQEYGKNWWSEFAAFYTGQKRTCDLSESCALQSLTAEVGRSDQATRSLFEAELLKINKLANDDNSHLSQEDIDRTWASLAMLTGGVSLARAVNNEALSSEISNAVKNAVIALHRRE